MKPSRLLSNLLAITSTAIAIASGLFILVGAFFTPNSGIQISLLSALHLTLLNWAIILAGFAIFIGLLSLLYVHFKKIQQKHKGSFYSLLLVISLVVTFIYGLIKPDQVNKVFSTVQIPVETSLLALLTVSLIYASIRLLRRRPNFLSGIFIITALIILLGTAPMVFLGDLPVLSDLVRPFIDRVLAVAGARGILLGMALGALTTGLRILFGADRPYGGNK
jgi:hypothetical protein